MSVSRDLRALAAAVVAMALTPEQMEQEAECKAEVARRIEESPKKEDPIVVAIREDRARRKAENYIKQKKGKS